MTPSHVTPSGGVTCDYPIVRVFKTVNHVQGSDYVTLGNGADDKWIGIIVGQLMPMAVSRVAPYPLATQVADR